MNAPSRRFPYLGSIFVFLFFLEAINSLYLEPLLPDKYQGLQILSRIFISAYGYFYLQKIKGVLELFRGPKKLALELPLFLIALISIPMTIGIGHWMGAINFTYGDNGLNPDFKRFLSSIGLIFIFSTWIGIEPIFRVLPFKAMGSPRSSTRQWLWIIFQSFLQTAWVTISLYPYLSYGETANAAYWVGHNFMWAGIAGWLFLISKSIWFPFLLMTFIYFQQLVIICDLEMGLNPMYGIVASSSSFWLASLITQTLLFLGIGILATKKAGS